MKQQNAKHSSAWSVKVGESVRTETTGSKDTNPKKEGEKTPIVLGATNPILLANTLNQEQTPGRVTLMLREEEQTTSPTCSLGPHAGGAQER